MLHKLTAHERSKATVSSRTCAWGQAPEVVKACVHPYDVAFEGYIEVLGNSTQLRFSIYAVDMIFACTMVLLSDSIKKTARICYLLQWLPYRNQSCRKARPLCL